MPETFPNYNPSGVPDGRSTGVQSIVGPGVTELGGDIYLANSDGTWGDQIGGGGGSGLPYQTFSGSPVGVVTPTTAGYMGLDTTNYALYFATGATSADWVQVSGTFDDTAIGFAVSPGGGVWVLDNSSAGVNVLEEGTGNASLEAATGTALISGVGGSTFGDASQKVSFFGQSPQLIQTVTGSLSTVADPAAQAVLTSIIAALAATGYGLVTDGTT